MFDSDFNGRDFLLLGLISGRLSKQDEGESEFIFESTFTTLKTLHSHTFISAAK